MRAAIYVRVSTEDQAKHGYSLHDQKESCKARALELGASEILEFADEGVSGELLERPGLTALRQSVKASQVDLVVCYDPDRLSRNLAHQLLVTDEIEKSGVQLDFVNFEWQNTPDGRLFYALRGAIAEFEKEKIRERTTRGKLQKAKQGGIPINANPYGYIFENGELKPHPVEAEIVRMIYRWFTTENVGFNTIVTRLAEYGIPSRKGNKTWQRRVIKTILSNPVYIGIFYYNRRNCQGMGYNKFLPIENRIKEKKRPTEEWIPIPVPALIDKETWDKAQEKTQKVRRLWSGCSKEKYLLSGLVTCTDCGNNMHGYLRTEKNGKKIRCYTCVHTEAGAINYGCRPIKRINADLLEQIVWEQVCAWLNNPEALIKEVRERSKEKELKTDLETINKHLAEVEKGRDNIRNALAAGLLELDGKTSKILQDLKSREKQLLVRKKEIEAALYKNAVTETKAKEIYGQAAKFLSRLDELVFDQKKALIRMLVKQVSVSGKGKNLRVTVFATFAPEAEIAKQLDAPG
ncbi:recombinase family protein [Moorella naiadis]|uniref:recombinase family protein n=1 Tax=Moorella naiadis (nom. illeg.) TaxID=3093670 RepID=UPI003D9C85F1